jgi:uncharacterized sulfatase
VQRYHYRPELELYDCDTDPLELHNLAANAEHAKDVARLKVKLQAWMTEQGDRGIETELDALLHQGRYKNMTREEAEKAWQKKQTGAKQKKPKNKEKTSS